MMALGDDKLRVMNSNLRNTPIIGTPDLVRKIRRREMKEDEYMDLTEGPTLITKIKRD
jgi:hypothetical protein